MITLGIDPHPGSHTVAALDLNGSVLGSIKVLNTSAGLEQLHQFASQFPSRRWAIEGAGNRFVVQFVNELQARGETIYPIAPSLTSQYRCRRGTKKNDQVDAANVARALLANPQLPSLQYSDRQRELQELSRAQRRLSEQLRSNRFALAELSEHSSVRVVLEEVIYTLSSQQGVREKASQYRSYGYARAVGVTRCWGDRGGHIASRSGRSTAIPDCRSFRQLLRGSPY
jgi:transposase